MRSRVPDDYIAVLAAGGDAGARGIPRARDAAVPELAEGIVLHKPCAQPQHTSRERLQRTRLASTRKGHITIRTAASCVDLLPPACTACIYVTGFLGRRLIADLPAQDDVSTDDVWGATHHRESRQDGEALLSCRLGKTKANCHRHKEVRREAVPVVAAR